MEVLIEETNPLFVQSIGEISKEQIKDGLRRCELLECEDGYDCAFNDVADSLGDIVDVRFNDLRNRLREKEIYLANESAATLPKLACKTSAGGIKTVEVGGQKYVIS